MLLIKYKNELFRFFIYTFALMLSIFIVSNIIIKDDIKESSDVETSIIETNDEITKLYVEYPRFKDEKINSLVTSQIYSYIKDFKSIKEDKILDITYKLYYFEKYVNITYHIENSLNNIKTKNLLINLDTKEMAYISQIYDSEELKNEILNLVFYKYSSEIYDKISSSQINNFTYILSDDKLSVYFNNIDFDDIDYIPYIELIFNEEASYINEEEIKNKLIAFTYDDGPSNYTKDLIKTLNLNNASATFFMIGNRMNKYSDIVKEIYNSSSEIGSHSYAHKDLTKLTNEELKNDLLKTNDIFYSITNDNLKYLRPPYIYTNKNVMNSGYTIVSWNIDPKDWLLKDSDKIYNNVITHVCDGCIVIMHDIYEPTIEATKMLLPKLTEMGYQVVSVSKLIEKKGYNVIPGKMVSSIK